MRVRFAPSPTGVLHIGGARTALYNWLLARGSGGQFVLRIEDTDRERSTPENVEQILEALRWLELDWDEGPHSQWERRDRHSEAVRRLLDSGHAYEDEGAVRFRVPDEGEISFHDAVLGEITNPYSAISDFVIQRSDGSPLYNLAVAVDDRDMGITHVVRGQDHVSNTPRQLMLLRALGAEPPVYAHIPLLHGPDGRKLSKRHGAASVQEVRDQGYLPQAVRNYLALLGWGYDESTTFMTTDELVERFSLERVSKNPAVFDEQKLRWMNGRYMRELPVDELDERLSAFYRRDIPPELVEISREKMQTLADFWPLTGTLLEQPRDFDDKAWQQWGGSPYLRKVRDALAAVDSWEPGDIESALRQIVDDEGVKPKEIFQPIRVALTGTTVSPGIFESIWALGREETLSRVEKALHRAESEVS
jgi:glutamyl-tRNA synthetase